MKPLMIGCAVIAVGMLLCGGCTAMYGLSTVNREVSLRNQVQAKSQSNQASLDTMVKIISQKCQVSGTWLKGQKGLVEAIIAGRTGGNLFKSVQEQNPNLSPELFKDVMNSIEGERKRFLRDQTQLVDFVRERQTLIDSPLSGFVVKTFGTTTKFYPRGDEKTPDGWSDDFQYTFVTSAATKTMVAHGEENDTKLDFGDSPTPAQKPAPKVEK